MKPTTKRKKTKGGPVTQKVRIDFHDEHAQQVSLAGTFNDWRPDAAPMLSLGDGRWVKELMLPPGRYEYLFVVDGEWRPDPAAVEQVLNAFGTRNSVLEVPASSPARQGTES
jgi:1,4-alpha-glucan branching enzyme